jgi:hypothetical protein
MCGNFNYEVVGQREKLKAIKKNVAQTKHEANSSWLKFGHAFH